MAQLTNSGTAWALAVSFCVLAGIGLLMVVAVFRRGQQVFYFRYVHSLRRRYRKALTEVLSGKSRDQGMQTLRRLPLSDLEILLDPIFSRRHVVEAHLGILRALCAELGLIELWQRRAAVAHRLEAQPHGSGRRARGVQSPQHLLRRAKGIRNLGILRHEPSGRFLVKALDDPHPDIQVVALRALAALHAPGNFPAVLSRLHAVALGRHTSPSLPAIEAALVNFNLRASAMLEVSLRHPEREIRRIATDTLRVMAGREAGGGQLPADALPAEIAELLLRDLSRDASGEVRGATAEILALLPDSRVEVVLHELLFDREWQVRLRAVRALGKSQHVTDLMVLGIRDCLRDAHSLVRDAAIHALIALGHRGTQHLYEHFLTTEDPVLRAQIVEAIERTGLLTSLVEGYSGGARGIEALMVEELASAAAPVGFSGVLQMVNPPVRERFQERFLPCARFRMRLLEQAAWESNPGPGLQPSLEFPPVVAA